MQAAISFSILNFSNALLAQSIASCCIYSFISACLITAFLSAVDISNKNYNRHLSSLIQTFQQIKIFIFIISEDIESFNKLSKDIKLLNKLSIGVCKYKQIKLHYIITQGTVKQFKVMDQQHNQNDTKNADRYAQKLKHLKNNMEKLISKQNLPITTNTKKQNYGFQQKNRREEPTKQKSIHPQFTDLQSFNSTLFKNESMFSNSKSHLRGNSQQFYNQNSDISISELNNDLNSPSIYKKQSSVLSKIDDVLERVGRNKNTNKNYNIQQSLNNEKPARNSRLLDNNQVSNISDSMNYSYKYSNFDQPKSKESKKYKQEAERENRKHNYLPPLSTLNTNLKLKTIEQEISNLNTLTIDRQRQIEKPPIISSRISQNSVDIQKAKIKQAMSGKKKSSEKVQIERTINDNSRNSKDQSLPLNISVDFQLSDDDQQNKNQIIPTQNKNNQIKLLIQEKNKLIQELQMVERQLEKIQSELA